MERQALPLGVPEPVPIWKYAKLFRYLVSSYVRHKTSRLGRFGSRRKVVFPFRIESLKPQMPPRLVQSLSKDEILVFDTREPIAVAFSRRPVFGSFSGQSAIELFKTYLYKNVSPLLD
jgi:hypothetical protein